MIEEQMEITVKYPENYDPTARNSIIRECSTEVAKYICMNKDKDYMTLSKDVMHFILIDKFGLIPKEKSKGESMSLEIQKYLRASENVEDALNKLRLKAIKIVEKGDLVLFKYSQLDSPLRSAIVQECRGLILDRKNWRIVSLPFKKFFNYGESEAAVIDWDSARILEKVDGTCMTLYYYNGEWRVQTLGTIDAEGELPGQDFTLADLFWKTFKDFKASLQQLDISECYTFELATKYNKVLTNYNEPQLVLIGRRDLLGFERQPDVKMFGPDNELRTPKEYRCDSLADIAKMAQRLPALEEGYVVVDRRFNRVKVKNPSYVALTHAKEGPSHTVRSLTHLAIHNEGSEFLSYFPQYAKQYSAIKEVIDTVRQDLKNIYSSCKHIEVQKDFALAIKATGNPLVDILFTVKAGRRDSVDSAFLDLLDAKRVAQSLNLHDLVF